MPREVEELVKDFENFLSVTQDARNESETDRDYEDHKQWTEEEVAVLEGRNQAPVVINRIKVKVNLLQGVQKQTRTDPRALPRTPEHEDAADAATDSLRFVADNTDVQQTSSDVFRGEIVWGYAGAIVEVEEKDQDFSVTIERIASDRFYFDPHSRRKDFKDAKFLGIVIWMDQDEAISTFPKAAEAIEDLLNTVTDSVDGSTFEDKPTWIDRARKRIRVCQHYYKENDTWMLAYFSGTLFLIDPQESPYLDEFGEPDCPIEAQTAYIDRDNNRYGEVRGYRWIQDEINHRRSKLLHNLSVRQTMGDQGIDVNHVKTELAQANGHVVVPTGLNFQILDNSDQTRGQFDLYQESKAEIDTVGANAALSGTPEQSMSGRAIQALQQGGIAELAGLYDGHKHWEKRIYRQAWNRIKQFWTAEKWIRVTDDESNLRWVGLNQPVTLGERLQEAAQQGDPRAQAALQRLIDDPRLNEVIDTQNDVAQLQVDIILSDSPDFVTLRQEQFETMSQLAQAYGPEAVPFDVMLELSDLPHRDEVMQMLRGEGEEADPQQQAAQAELIAMEAQRNNEAKDVALAQAKADVAATVAKTDKDAADARAQNLESDVVESELSRLING
jgi:hypothetical protein